MIYLLTISAPAVDTVAMWKVSKETKSKFKEAVLPLKTLTPHLVAYCADLGTALMLSSAINFLIGNIWKLATGSHFGFIQTGWSDYTASYQEPLDQSDC